MRRQRSQQQRSNHERYKKRLPEKSTIDVDNDSHELDEDQQFFSIRKSESDHPQRGPDRMEELLSLMNRETTYSQGRDSTSHDVSELFSPPRITKRAENRGLRAGHSIDINSYDPITGLKYDLRKNEDRKQVRQLRTKHRSNLWILSPPRQNLRPGGVQPHEAAQFVDFAVEIAISQITDDLHFLFEHPIKSEAWQQESMQKLMKMPGVITVELDQCAYGLSTTDEDGTAPVKRPTRIVTTLTAAELLLTRK